MNKLLLIVDPQIDFITGTLPVENAAEAMNALATYVKTNSDTYSLKVVTLDWHPFHHSSFADEGGLWPRHCVQHSTGAAYWLLLINRKEDLHLYIKEPILEKKNTLLCRMKHLQIFSIN